MKLYEIIPAMNKLEEMSENNEELVPYLDSIQLQLNDKVNNIVKFTRGLEVSAEAIDAEIKRLCGLKANFENKASNLRGYISDQMLKNGIVKIETDVAKLSFRKSQSVEITDEKLIPETYKKKKVIENVDKMALKEALKTGLMVDGAVLVEKNNLQIR